MICQEPETREDDATSSLFKLTDSNIKKSVHNNPEGAKKSYEQ